MDFASARYQLIELAMKGPTLPGANQITSFLPQQQLQSYVQGQIVFVHKIVCFSNASLSQSPLTSGLQVASPTQIQGATLTLVAQGTNRFAEVPLSELVSVQTASGSFTPFNWQAFFTRDLYTVDWSKSYVRNVVSLTGQDPFSYVFGVHYSYQPDPYLDWQTIRDGINFEAQ